MDSCVTLSQTFGLFILKQKTAYETYQCDWSSDVCSSDLVPALHVPVATPCGDTRRETRVAVIGVGIVALLDAGLDEAIAAHRGHARRRTCIGVVAVGVVALLDAGLDDPVAAPRADTRREARVAVIGVGI